MACTGSGLNGPFSTARVEVDGHELTVWVADQPSQRHQGLREVDHLPSGVDGMLFVYATPADVTFGMLNTLIPLDIWWFDAGGALIGSAEMTPCDAEPCAAYRSPGPIKWVLETPLGVYRFPDGAGLTNVESS